MKMNQNELQEDRDYWKQRCHDMQEDMKLFVTVTMVVIMTICVELILKRYWPVPLH
jgi:hypothetical protein